MMTLKIKMLYFPGVCWRYVEQSIKNYNTLKGAYTKSVQPK